MKSKTLTYSIFITISIIISLSFEWRNHKNDEKYILKVSNIRRFTINGKKCIKMFVVFTNKTNDTLQYLSWSCIPVRFLYCTDSNILIWSDTTECVSYVPIGLVLLPHEKRKDTLLFQVKNSEKFPAHFRVGFMIAKDNVKNSRPFFLNKGYDYTIVWSKPVSVEAK
jgi:hypothetical protein